MKIDRLISIIMILLDRERINIQELANICEVTTRTIHRNLDAINQAGIPIVSYPGPGGGVGIMENYKLEKRLFSTADITTLLMGQASIRSSLSGDEVVNVLAKIRGIIPEEQRKEIELNAGQITIDMTPWVGSHSCQNVIRIIQTAMDSHRLLGFQYSDRIQNKSARTIEPYRLILKNISWYVEGYCLDQQDYRGFKLSRMSSASLLDGVYEPRSFNPSPLLQPSFKDKEVVSATLRAKDCARERLIDLFGEQCSITQERDATWIMQIPITNNARGYQYLIGLGLDCECLEPVEVREGMHTYLKKMLKLYS